MVTAISKRGPFKREKWLNRILTQKRFYSPTLLFLHALSFFYGAAVTVRNWLYDIGLIPQKVSCLPVVSVGAIACGGTRKTPLTAHIAKKLQRPVAILTSGYAAGIREMRKCVSIAAHGDEAYLLSLKVPFAKVYANKNRVKSVRNAEKEGVDYVLLDSGLQHRALHRDIEIITLSANDPLCGGRYLPRGYLKDTPKRLKSANWIVIMDSENESEYEKVCEEVRKINKHAAFIGMKGVLVKPELVRNKRIGVFCGIAKPDSFVDMLKKEGCEIISKMVLSDHEPMEQVCAFVEESKNKGAEFVVCTEKDFVKLPPQECEGVVPLELVVEVCYSNFEYQKMLSAIKAKCER